MLFFILFLFFFFKRNVTNAIDQDLFCIDWRQCSYFMVVNLTSFFPFVSKSRIYVLLCSYYSSVIISVLYFGKQMFVSNIETIHGNQTGTLEK